MKLIIYRIFTFLLFPVALVFTISCLLFFGAAFANPSLLLSIFLIACVVIYTFASLNFLIRGIDGKKLLGKSSKDWLKVNAIVSIVLSLLMITNSIYLMTHTEMLTGFAEEMIKNSEGKLNTSPENLSRLLLGTCYFLLIYAAVLFVHILLSFQYIKTYGYLFQNKEN